MALEESDVGVLNPRNIHLKGLAMVVLKCSMKFMIRCLRSSNELKLAVRSSLRARMLNQISI